LERNVSLWRFRPLASPTASLGWVCEAAQIGLFRHQHRGAQTTKSSHVCPSVRSYTSAKLRVEMMRGHLDRKRELNFTETNGEELHVLAPPRIESGFRYLLSYSVSDLKIMAHKRLKNTTAVKAKHSVPRFAERVSAVPPVPRRPSCGEMFLR
jgi:hypothetical protein